MENETKNSTATSSTDVVATKENKMQKIMEIKKRLLENPDSIVIAPHTQEGFIFAKLLLIADKYIWLLRKKAGVTIDLEIVEQHLDRVNKYIRSMEELVGPGDVWRSGFTAEDKYKLGMLKRSFVFVPRTAESRLLISQFKRIDPLLVHMRATQPVEELTKKAKVIAEKIREFDELIKDIANTVDSKLFKKEAEKVYYKTPAEVKRIIKSIDPDSAITSSSAAGA